MVCLCIWQLFWTLVISWFLTFANANMHCTFFSPNLHVPFTPRYIFYFFFMIGFNFIGLFNLSLQDFCTLFQLHFLNVSVSLASLSYFNISKLCVCLLFQFQFQFLHHLFGFLGSLVPLTFNLPLFFVSMFQYHS